MYRFLTFLMLLLGSSLAFLGLYSIVQNAPALNVVGLVTGACTLASGVGLLERAAGRQMRTPTT